MVLRDFILGSCFVSDLDFAFVIAVFLHAYHFRLSVPQKSRLNLTFFVMFVGISRLINFKMVQFTTNSSNSFSTCLKSSFRDRKLSRFVRISRHRFLLVRLNSSPFRGHSWSFIKPDNSKKHGKMWRVKVFENGNRRDPWIYFYAGKFEMLITFWWMELYVTTIRLWLLQIQNLPRRRFPSFRGQQFVTWPGQREEIIILAGLRQNH